MQKKAIPIALKKRDILAAAQSGTGKTAAFLLPILEDLLEQKQKNELPILRALILVPTRELATQIAKAVDDFAKYMQIEKLAVFGGVSSKEQERKIAKGIDILVATSGRLMEHIKNKSVDLSSVNTVVIDEVDTMLDMGFLEDIEKILPNVGPHRQIMMFSATMNQNVKKLAKEFLTDPVVIEVASQRSTVKIIEQQIVLVDEAKKAELLSYLIGSKNYSQVLVFVNMKKEADELVAHLNLDGLPAECIHGDVRQTARAKALRKFKSGDIRVLVATDIAARGIDIELLPVVVNFALPETIADYTHRIGRTGRAGNAGTAITLLSVKDYKFMIEIEKELIINIPRIEMEGFETTEKKPRLFKARPKQLSVKKAEAKKVAQKSGFSKTNVAKKPAKKKKTTKRDDNRSFRK
ncbi:MAG: DEAD/DEAH box helicase [Arcobacter sp.]|uniref:DEAD/DEAH box helicase n=1 Tax=Arcobacter sp. TaxID=1872629 RepID=UPI00258C678B|nr:DEAD/DEAH box helicase [Arcobacter sp.]MDD3008152.1 DEAD/DEAH box helicase [Arcobacter sp.]MDY3205349.1 DEAD/DEAH box helicase [Arcobacter sp.]